MRTHHGGDENHFAYSFNKDGTISPLTEPDLVFGLADPSPCDKFRDIIANHKDWKLSRTEKLAEEKAKKDFIADLIKQSNHEVLSRIAKLEQTVED